MTPKELISLAKACRKAGITHFKQGDVEFTLDANTQVKVIKPKAKQTVLNSDTPIASDELSQDALLFWSSEDPTHSNDKAEQ